MSDEPPAAYLFTNGNAIYFDDEGEQLPEFQKRKWLGLSDYLGTYPSASVYVSDYAVGEAIQLDEKAIDQITV